MGVNVNALVPVQHAATAVNASVAVNAVVTMVEARKMKNEHNSRRTADPESGYLAFSRAMHTVPRYSMMTTSCFICQHPKKLSTRNSYVIDLDLLDLDRRAK
jgi:hypothetical protein